MPAGAAMRFDVLMADLPVNVNAMLPAVGQVGQSRLCDGSAVSIIADSGLTTAVDEDAWQGQRDAIRVELEAKGHDFQSHEYVNGILGWRPGPDGAPVILELGEPVARS